jgi:hypothetical protein
MFSSRVLLQRSEEFQNTGRRLMKPLRDNSAHRILLYSVVCGTHELLVDH